MLAATSDRYEVVGNTIVRAEVLATIQAAKAFRSHHILVEFLGAGAMFSALLAFAARVAIALNRSALMGTCVDRPVCVHIQAARFGGFFSCIVSTGTTRTSI